MALVVQQGVEDLDIKLCVVGDGGQVFEVFVGSCKDFVIEAVTLLKKF